MLLTKTTGKPYAGKPHVRFDEGAGGSTTPPALLYCAIKNEGREINGNPNPEGDALSLSKGMELL